MNFFKSVFSDDPEPTKSESASPNSEPRSPGKQDQDRDPLQNQTPPSSNPNPSSSSWDFGGLIKALTSKSESVIETYRRDLQEFGSGLKKEIEVAQGSLGTVGHAIDEFGSSVLKGTAQIISHGKDAILSADLGSEGSPRGSAMGSDGGRTFRRYSRFSAQVRAVQGDAGTYCEEPEDLDDYRKWKSGFDLGEKEEEVRSLSEENDVVRSVYEKVVPGTVDHGTFWCRYFYRMHKLKQAESFRASLVRRAISSEDEELSWDVDDEDEELEKGAGVNVVEPKSEDSEKIASENSGVKKVDCEAEQVDELPKRNLGVKEEIGVEARGSLDDKRGEDVAKGETDEMIAKSREASLKGGRAGKDSEMNRYDPEPRANVGVVSNVKVEPEKSSGRDGNTARGFGRGSATEEEDLGWDEIEDLSSIDDHKVSHGGSPSPNRAELRKRLGAAEEEEDLSWEIEDDDEPAKA